MPQLLSRMDDINWLTPSMAEILDQGAAPPGGDGSIREQMVQLQKDLAELETPARIINVRSTPSHTLFVTRPDTVGRLGNRRPVTQNEVKRSLGKIAEKYKEAWTLGFMPQVQDQADTVGILLRTDAHNPLSLRRMMVRSAYRDHESTFAFILGNTLDQRLVVDDLATLGHLLVVGSANAKLHFMRSLLITLVCMNTPGEMRLVLAGNDSEYYERLLNIPHTVRKLLKNPDEGQRLFLGLVKEMERRLRAFQNDKTESILDYNNILDARNETTLPHIIVVLDSLANDAWQTAKDSWLPFMRRLLEDGGKTGIHIIAVAENIERDVPVMIEPLLTRKLVMRPAITNELDNVSNFHSSLTRFVDAVILDSELNVILPVELCEVTEKEMQKAVSYWIQAQRKRKHETREEQISGTTGMTGMLGQTAVQKAMQVKTSMSQDIPAPPAPEPQMTNAPHILQQAQALAAYLGWIGVGPLQDVLNISLNDANQIITQLQQMGVVENNTSTTPRFVRLSDIPADF